MLTVFHHCQWLCLMELLQVPCSSEMCLPYCQWVLAKNKHCLLTMKTFSKIRLGRGFELFKKKQIPIHILKFYNGNVSKSPQTMNLVTPSFEPKNHSTEISSRPCEQPSAWHAGWWARPPRAKRELDNTKRPVARAAACGDPNSNISSEFV